MKSSGRFGRQPIDPKRRMLYPFDLERKSRKKSELFRKKESEDEILRRVWAAAHRSHADKKMGGKSRPVLSS